MNKIFTLLLLIVVSQANAQCIPDPNNTAPGVYPSVLTTGCNNVAYSDTVQIVSPVDTVLFNFTLPFDSLIIINTLNLPAGLSFACGNISCSTVASPPQPMRSCIVVSGTPSATTVPGSTFSIVVVYYVTVPFVGVQSIPDTLIVGLDIDACLGINSNSGAATQIYPNPAQDQLNISLGAGLLSASSKFTIYNAVGQKVLSSTLTAEQSAISLVGLTDGIYFVTLENEEGVISRERVVIRK